MELIERLARNAIAGCVEQVPASMFQWRSDAQSTEGPSVQIVHLKANCPGMVDPRELTAPIEVA